MGKYRSVKSVTWGVSIVWAAVIFASALVLQGTPYFGQMLPILAGGAGGTIVLIGGLRKRKADCISE